MTQPIVALRNSANSPKNPTLQKAALSRWSQCSDLLDIPISPRAEEVHTWPDVSGDAAEHNNPVAMGEGGGYLVHLSAISAPRFLAEYNQYPQAAYPSRNTLKMAAVSSPETSVALPINTASYPRRLKSPTNRYTRVYCGDQHPTLI
jgi:hypothetical protein